MPAAGRSRSAAADGGPSPSSHTTDKVRLDRLLLARGLAPTRTRAQERIAAGAVIVNGTVARRASLLVAPDAILHVEADIAGYVSRGGIKLAAALDTWRVDLAGRLCLDIGVSSGGFTDCMLRRGARRVIGVDAGHGQLAASLREDPRVTLREGTNARSLRPGDLPENISFLAVDVSFIGASLVLPAVVQSAFRGAAGPIVREAVVLIKPQFEAGREFVGRGGLVRDARGLQVAVERVRGAVTALGGENVTVIESPILGGDGNREFLLYARF
jgi:23S rRNA (cytidine1920-2'-O)/16S rRNA (cytidine1409-2'-O)-methyltransferase